ncbi:MAG: DUF2231 domain-containing protein [Alphaproteobacteria bacterium]
MLRLEAIHPIMTHFPIVFVLTLAAFDTLVLMVGRGIGGRSAVANVSAGLAVLTGIGAAAAYLFGDAAYDIAIEKGFPESALETHQILGTTAAAVLALWALIRAFLWWRGAALAGGRSRAVAGIEIAAAVLILVTAYFGGHLVYELGVNVAVVNPHKI